MSYLAKISGFLCVVIKLRPFLRVFISSIVLERVKLLSMSARDLTTPCYFVKALQHLRVYSVEIFRFTWTNQSIVLDFYWGFVGLGMMDHSSLGLYRSQMCACPTSALTAKVKGIFRVRDANSIAFNTSWVTCNRFGSALFLNL